MRLLACQALSIAIAATLVSSPAAALADGRSAGYQPAGNGWVDNATDPNATTAAMLADAIRYRTEMGLNAEPDFVATIERDASADRSFGVALTPIELADINARMAVQEAIGPLAEFVDEHSDSLGGWYLDQLKHAQIAILGTSGAGDAISAAQALAPKGATVRVEMVKNPWGSETRIRSCGEPVVLVDEPAEQVPPTDVARLVSRALRSPRLPPVVTSSHTPLTACFEPNKAPRSSRRRRR